MKRVVFVLATLLALAVFTSCAKKVECDFCGEMKKCEEKSMLGEQVYICDDCYDELTQLAE